MAGTIEIYDTEAFSGQLVGPLLYQYELQFERTEGWNQTVIRKPLHLDKYSKFFLPLPAEMEDSDESISIQLKEIKSGRCLYDGKIALGRKFYHNLGTISASPQLQLEGRNYRTLSQCHHLIDSHLLFITFLLSAVMVSLFAFYLCWRCPGRSTQKEVPPCSFKRIDSVSSLTTTDNESTSRHSLAHLRKQRGHKHPEHHHRLQQHVKPGKRIKVHHRRLVFNPYDASSPEHEQWDPWFDTTGW